MCFALILASECIFGAFAEGLESGMLLGTTDASGALS